MDMTSVQNGLSWLADIKINAPTALAGVLGMWLVWFLGRWAIRSALKLATAALVFIAFPNLACTAAVTGASLMGLGVGETFNRSETHLMTPGLIGMSIFSGAAIVVCTLVRAGYRADKGKL